MSALAEREIVCSSCGDGLGEYASAPPYDKVGRCCENLPAPWGRDQESGLYVVPRSPRLGQQLRDGEIDEEDYDEADEVEMRDVPRCAGCGNEAFTLRYTETRYCSVNSAEAETGDERIFFLQGYEDSLDSEEHGHFVECADCGMSSSYPWEWT